MITALIDADIIAFQAAAVAQTWVPDTDGRILYQIADYSVAERYIDNFIADIADSLDATPVCALSDREHNWRKDVLPSYKENRKDTIPPVLRYEMYQYIVDNYETFIRPTLEGDDVLGILSTSNRIKGTKIIVSIDKDMKTIPGLVLNWNHARYAYNNDVIPRISSAVLEVTEEQADYFHLLQTLAGDQTDGYSGCPGIGMQTADEILTEEPHVVFPVESVISRGPNKGQTRIKWEKDFNTGYTYWDTIVSYYLKAGLTEADALQQARVARICRASDYDFKRKEVRLWTPKN